MITSSREETERVGSFVRSAIGVDSSPVLAGVGIEAEADFVNPFVESVWADGNVEPVVCEGGICWLLWGVKIRT